MEWTTEKPTKPGWYWIAQIGPYARKGALIKHIYKNEDEGKMYIDDLHDYGMYSEQEYVDVDEYIEENDFVVHWIGPLAEPELPEESH